MQWRSCGGDAFCPRCYDNVRRRGNHAGHVAYVHPRAKKKGRVIVYARRKPAESPDGVHLGQLLSCEFGSQFPSLWSFLTDIEFDDGTARQTGTVLLVVDDARAKVWLNDRAEGLSCWVSGSTLLDALESADRGLRNGGLDWRASTKTKPGRRG